MYCVKRRLTTVKGEFLSEVVVGLFGHLVGGAVVGLVLIQDAADPFNPLQQAVVVLIHQTLDPAAGWAFRALAEQGEAGQDEISQTVCSTIGLRKCFLFWPQSVLKKETGQN